MTPADFGETIRRNTDVSTVLERLPELGLPQCHLTAGCLFQSVWNVRSGQVPGWGIRDYDVFYWHQDSSWEAEDEAIHRAAALFADLPIRLEVRNQRRVHLWYEKRFGTPCPPLSTTRSGIDRFLVACTAVGVAVDTGEIYAPHGLDDLVAGVLRVNPHHRDPAQFLAKAEDYRARWPWLRIVRPG